MNKLEQLATGMRVGGAIVACLFTMYTLYTSLQSPAYSVYHRTNPSVIEYQPDLREDNYNLQKRGWHLISLSALLIPLGFSIGTRAKTQRLREEQENNLLAQYNLEPTKENRKLMPEIKAHEDWCLKHGSWIEYKS
jgi:hypothetical protein